MSLEKAHECKAVSAATDNRDLPSIEQASVSTLGSTLSQGESSQQDVPKVPSSFHLNHLVWKLKDKEEENAVLGQLMLEGKEKITLAHELLMTEFAAVSGRDAEVQAQLRDLKQQERSLNRKVVELFHDCRNYTKENVSLVREILDREGDLRRLTADLDNRVRHGLARRKENYQRRNRDGLTVRWSNTNTSVISEPDSKDHTRASNSETQSASVVARTGSADQAGDGAGKSRRDGINNNNNNNHVAIAREKNIDVAKILWAARDTLDALQIEHDYLQHRIRTSHEGGNHQNAEETDKNDRLRKQNAQGLQPCPRFNCRELRRRLKEFVERNAS